MHHYGQHAARLASQCPVRSSISIYTHQCTSLNTTINYHKTLKNTSPETNNVINHHPPLINMKSHCTIRTNYLRSKMIGLQCVLRTEVMGPVGGSTGPELQNWAKPKSRVHDGRTHRATDVWVTQSWRWLRPGRKQRAAGSGDAISECRGSLSPLRFWFVLPEQEGRFIYSCLSSIMAIWTYLYPILLPD